MYLGAACMAYKQLFEWQNRIFLQNMNISDRFRLKQPNTVDLFQSFELADQCMEMLNKRQYHIHSHQNCPSSVLCLSALQSVSVYKLYSRPHCIVLNLCFLFRPGISHWLGFDPVTDVPPARASHCSSSCHQLEKVLVRIMYLRCTLWQVSAMRCFPAAQRDCNLKFA